MDKITLLKLLKKEGYYINEEEKWVSVSHNITLDLELTKLITKFGYKIQKAII